MGVAIKRFLIQFTLRDTKAHELLYKRLRKRYAPSVNQPLGDTGKESESRCLLPLQAMEVMYLLIPIVNN